MPKIKVPDFFFLYSPQNRAASEMHPRTNKIPPKIIPIDIVTIPL
jgi:hypothetical protein